ncbi:MAG: vanadium-dependent haloperoxidase, partial [Xenococcaceae cyanobacterium MO_167.B52]|nr:vanadium-dependent haloperoxidase [Xenococcaceae cyanobacterium MO_167.B52]
DGDLIGPYLSQFLLIGSPGHENNQNNVTDGLIGYGALKVEQKLVPAQSELDHMTTWDVFLDVQDAANLKGTDNFSPPEDSSSFLPKRFITYPRDLATYVHFDALYEAYLNACLILLGFNAPVDPGISHLNNIFSERAIELSAGDFGRVDGFALFGGPHILNLVTEVSTRALKAVRYQKFNVHCRLRPEALAGWMEAIRRDATSPIRSISQLMKMYNDLFESPLGGVNLFDELTTHNREQNAQAKFAQRSYVVNTSLNQENVLLPMAFPEGSPMHPAYGAGHATVAGACVTMLKAFFDTSAVIGRDSDSEGDIKITSRQEYDDNGYQPVAFIADSSGTNLEDIYQSNPPANPLTVGDELNKIAANISIGRNMAGVHYYSDYIDSLVMGEKIALGVLLEQSLADEIYPEAVLPSFSLTAFLKDGMVKRQIEISQGKIIVNGQETNWCDL